MWAPFPFMDFSHTIAMLALYAAVNGPASFNDRFGYWQYIGPPARVATPHPVKHGLGIKRGGRVPKSINVQTFCPCGGH